MNFNAPFRALLKCNHDTIWIVKPGKLIRNWFNAIAIVTLCACASTKPIVDANVKIDFPPTERIESTKQADTVLQAVALSRAQIEWRYRQQEQICYDKFFTNACLLEAKDQRRIDLATVKKSEVEANYFKRKNTVEEMDKALAEKNKLAPATVTEHMMDKK